MKIGFKASMLLTPFEAWRDTFWVGCSRVDRCLGIAGCVLGLPIFGPIFALLLLISLAEAFHIKR